MNEGAGKAGCTKRTHSLACKMSKAHKHSHYRSAGIPGLPCAMVLTASFVLSLVSRAFLPPSPVRIITSQGLISASGYQDHTTSPSATTRFVFTCHRRPPHPAPNVRDDRETPLVRGAGRQSSIAVSTQLRSDIFFAGGLDKTAKQSVKRSMRPTAGIWHDGLRAICRRGHSRHLAVLAQTVQGLMLTEAAQFEVADFKYRCLNFGGKSTSHE